ncbi:hypothetical protein AGABI2DRAFT_71771 [Agaricus bisporus var. bisporus H97]|nr:hypothetical protein AGABI2DRAFT_71771 [Agaricus bisporus var. bisporus H97]EKV46445.1 hypothetical protein AGABI2DRAFT_71771 [Agaricus bisporus var. bisporus H97]
MSCCICLEGLQCPVSLPCGHIFCRDCLKRVVQAVQPYSTLHACPTCRAHYYIPCPNLSTVPPHLRPYIIPSIRRVYLDLPSKPEQTDASTSHSSDALSTEIARLRAENDALRHNCCMWRKRAEVHSAATLGLLEMSKTAKDQIFQLAQERDQIRNEHRKLEHDYQQQK